jgi:hypothetical protein
MVLVGKDVRPSAPERQLVLPPFSDRSAVPCRKTARVSIDYWIENCVHASEVHGTIGAEQDVSALAVRCVWMASTLGFSKAALEQEGRNISAYIGSHLLAVNRLERDRRV